MKKINNWIKRFLEQHLTGVVLRFLSRQPLARLQKWGDWLGDLIYRNNTKSAKITRKNLSLVYPELSADELEKKVRLSLQETMKTGLEFGWCWMAPLDQIIGAVREVHGLDRVHDVYAKGHGVIVMGPHLGNWELFGHFINHHYTFSAMYAPQNKDSLDGIIYEGRCRAGMNMVPANIKGVAVLLKLLKQGAIVGNLPDQEPDDLSGGVFAPFMGIPAFSPKLVTRLISKTGARVVAGFAERLPNGEGFNIHFIDADEEIYSPDEVEAVAAMNRTVEQLVMLAPDQYQWEYKRFKRRPQGEKKLYKARELS